MHARGLTLQAHGPAGGPTQRALPVHSYTEAVVVAAATAVQLASIPDSTCDANYDTIVINNSMGPMIGT